MNTNSKRKDTMADDKATKRVKKECSYGESCYRRNPAHLREFSHPHLESILDAHTGGNYPIPKHLHSQRQLITEQLEIIVEKQLYSRETKRQPQDQASTSNSTTNVQNSETKHSNNPTTTSMNNSSITTSSSKTTSMNTSESQMSISEQRSSTNVSNEDTTKGSTNKVEKRASSLVASSDRQREADYRPVVPPQRRAEDYLKVVVAKNKMAAKHAASAPYYIFYTTISDAPETHNQPYSITFLEILDSSLGELRCSLQINFMVDAAWLLAQYYFAGYSEKKLTILYGEDAPDLRDISKKKPHVDAHLVKMATPFGKHHTKMMLLCYEDGSLRVVVSTANLYHDDWENRTQGLWFSPKCPELPPDAMPHDGESPTLFKRSLLKYLNHYHLQQLGFYVERVKRCDFTNINVFLVASVPGGHFDQDWSMARMGALLKDHCICDRQWPLIAQASSLGGYGKEDKLWLTGDFLHYFTKTKNQPQVLASPPELKLIYPSLENVRQSHDGLLGGGCLPYSAESHAKQPWLNKYLYQWQATSSCRNKAMPHIKSYLRCSPDGRLASFYLLTSGNVSKAAWGQFNKGNGALRVMSYEAGVLFLPRLLINEDVFPLELGAKNRLIIPYDLPPVKYTQDMSAWVQDYLL